MTTQPNEGRRWTLHGAKVGEHRSVQHFYGPPLDVNERVEVAEVTDSNALQERLTKQREYEVDVVVSLSEMCDRVEEFAGALGELVDWQPSTKPGLAALHPQHLEALKRARAALSSEEAA